MKFLQSFPILLLALVNCNGPDAEKVQLSDFQDNVSVKALGARLIELPMGMQSLESNLQNANQITIAVI